MRDCECVYECECNNECFWQTWTWTVVFFFDVFGEYVQWQPKYEMRVVGAPLALTPLCCCRHWLSSALVATTLQSISVDSRQSVNQSVRPSLNQSVGQSIPRLVSNYLWLSTMRPVTICDRLKLKLNRNQRILSLESQNRRLHNYTTTTTTSRQG